MKTGGINWTAVAREDAADAYEVWSSRRHGMLLREDGPALVLLSNGQNAAALRTERKIFCKWLDARGGGVRELAWALHSPKGETDRCGMAIVIDQGCVGGQEIADNHAAIVARLDSMRGA